MRKLLQMMLTERWSQWCLQPHCGTWSMLSGWVCQSMNLGQLGFHCGSFICLSQIILLDLKLLVSFSELKGISLLNIIVVATVIRHKFNTYYYWIEEMIFTLAGQSQWLSHLCTCKISGVFNGIQTHNLCDASAALLPTVWSHSDVRRSICWAHLFLWKEWRVKEMFMNCGWEMKWSSYCLVLKCEDHF